MEFGHPIATSRLIKLRDFVETQWNAMEFHSSLGLDKLNIELVDRLNVVKMGMSV